MYASSVGTAVSVSNPENSSSEGGEGKGQQTPQGFFSASRPGHGDPVPWWFQGNKRPLPGAPQLPQKEGSWNPDFLSFVLRKGHWGTLKDQNKDTSPAFPTSTRGCFWPSSHLCGAQAPPGPGCCRPENRHSGRAESGSWYPGWGQNSFFRELLCSWHPPSLQPLDPATHMFQKQGDLLPLLFSNLASLPL